MLLKIISAAGCGVGIVLLMIGFTARWKGLPEDHACRACDLLLAVAAILTLGSASVYLLVP